jgi:hypothetical protein
MKRRHRKRKLKTASRAKATTATDAEKAVGPSPAPGPSSFLASGDVGHTHSDDESVAAVEVKESTGDYGSGSSNRSGALAGAEYVIDLSDEFIGAAGDEKTAGDSVTLGPSAGLHPSTALARTDADFQTNPRDEFPAAVHAGKPAGNSVAPAGADRRTHPRYEFIAAGEVVAAESGARIETRVRDLSQQGCYVDTTDALPLGTVTGVRITKGAQLFEARARVVYSRTGKGMGLVFTDIEAERVRTLETWIAESRETSWLAANRRRSQRVLMTVPVRVSGQTGGGLPFDEETHTRAISAHGALILVSAHVQRGQRLTLSNVQTKASLECVVAHVDRKQSSQPQVGVEFTMPNPIFWHVAFPPKDWTPRHPHAKSQVKIRESS